MYKKIKFIGIPVIFILFVFMMLFFLYKQNTVTIFVIPSENGPDITATVSSKTSETEISAFQTADGHYFLFLPSYAEHKYVNFDLEGFSIDSPGNIFTLKTSSGLEFTIDGKYTLTLLTGSDIPTVSLTLKHDLSYIQLDKELSDSGSALVLSPEGSTIYSGKLKSIHGRGNTSWEQDKKPFNLELSDPVSLLGSGTSLQDKYCLISSTDETFLRNKISYGMAKCMDAATTAQELVNLYINNEYQGVYELWERITPETLGITDLEQETKTLNTMSGPPSQFTTGRYLDDWNHSVTGKWWNYPMNPSSINGGYLLEADQAIRYGNEASGFTLKSGAYIVSKSPTMLTGEQYHYISSYTQACENAMQENVGNTEYGTLSNYIDTQSFVTKYLIKEVSKNIDCSSTSQFFYKDTNGLLKAGPPWDYDWAYGVSRTYGSEYEHTDYGIDFMDPEGFSARNIPGSLIWWQLLYYNNAFYEDLTSTYANTLYPWLSQVVEQYLPEWESNLADSAAMDYIRWNRTDTSELSAVLDAYHGKVAQVSDFISSRKEFLSREWTTAVQE